MYDNGTWCRTSAYGVGTWALFVVESFDPARAAWRWYYGTDGDFNYFPDDRVYRSKEYAMSAANRWHEAIVLAALEPDLDG